MKTLALIVVLIVLGFRIRNVRPYGRYTQLWQYYDENTLNEWSRSYLRITSSHLSQVVCA